MDTDNNVMIAGKERNGRWGMGMDVEEVIEEISGDGKH